MGLSLAIWGCTGRPLPSDFLAFLSFLAWDLGLSGHLTSSETPDWCFCQVFLSILIYRGLALFSEDCWTCFFNDTFTIHERILVLCCTGRLQFGKRAKGLSGVCRLLYNQWVHCRFSTASVDMLFNNFITGSEGCHLVHSYAIAFFLNYSQM